MTPLWKLVTQKHTAANLKNHILKSFEFSRQNSTKKNLLSSEDYILFLVWKFKRFIHTFDYFTRRTWSFLTQNFKFLSYILWHDEDWNLKFWKNPCLSAQCQSLLHFFKVWFFPIFRTFSKSKQKLPFVNIQFITTEGFLADLPPSEVVLCMNFSKTSQHFHLHFSRKTSEK